MTAYPIPNPFSQWVGITGLPLTGAKIYIGEPNQDPETHPIAVYQDTALTIGLAQPIRTSGGYLSGTGTPINAFPSSTPYSIRVRTSAGVEVFYRAEVHDAIADLAKSDGAEKIGWQQVTSTLTRTVNAKLLEAPESPDDFTGNDTVAFTNVLNSRSAGVDAKFLSKDYIGTFDVQRSAVSVAGPLGCLENDTGPTAVGLRPVSTGAGTHTVLIGGTTEQLIRVSFDNAEISGDNGSGGMAESALLLKSLNNGSFDNCSFRDGTVTVDIRPEEGPAVTAVGFSKAWVRNQTATTSARCLKLTRGASDTNYVTAISFAQSHFNGPVNGYVTEQTGVPTTLALSQTYLDVKPWRGALVADGHTLSGFHAQIDPGASNVPVVETLAPVGTDPTRTLFGNFRIGGQQIKSRRATVTGSIAGNVLTVTANSAPIVAGDDLDGSGIDHTNGGVDPTGAVHITINAFGSGGTSGTGNTGTYQLSISQPTLTSRTFSVGPVYTLPTEMEWYFYRPCINQAFIRGDMQFDAAGTTFGAGPKIGPSGTDLISYNRTNFYQAIQFFGGTLNAAASLDVNGGTGGFRVTALGTAADTDIRFDPKGAGAVKVNGYGILPVGLTQNIGSSGTPFVDIYAVNALHVTSDARSKNWQTAIADSPDKAKYLAASKAIHAKFGFFVWNDSEDAGWHCGNMAQDVIQAFIDQGLEPSITGPFKHTMFAYDMWEANDSREAGNRYTLSGEFDKFMIWAMGERLNALEAA